jgi:peptide deformylase
MAVKKIHLFNSLVLTLPCRRIVAPITAETEQLALDLKDTLEHHIKKGYGLAAPQIGILQRMFAFVNLQTGNIGIFINPKCDQFSANIVEQRESCLSYPGLWKSIKRPEWGLFSGLDITGKEMKIKVEGLQARIFFHEIDHLNGQCRVVTKKRR